MLVMAFVGVSELLLSPVQTPRAVYRVEMKNTHQYFPHISKQHLVEEYFSLLYMLEKECTKNNTPTKPSSNLFFSYIF